MILMVRDRAEALPQSDSADSDDIYVWMKAEKDGKKYTGSGTGNTLEAASASAIAEIKASMRKP